MPVRDRAQATAPGFELTSGNAETVALICRRLDGLPLAIELAAARIRMLPPRALLARLDDGLTVLAGGPRDLPERQRTLTSTLDWSFGLLTADEQTLFARLGLFAGSFGLQAARAVCAGEANPAAGDGAEPDQHLVDTLGALVDSSLVRAAGLQWPAPRFTLLDTVREYALERLRATDGWAEVHQRHASYFQALAEPRDDELQGTGQLAWLDRLETRHPDLVAALAWLVDTGQIGPACPLCVGDLAVLVAARPRGGGCPGTPGRSWPAAPGWPRTTGPWRWPGARSSCWPAGTTTRPSRCLSRACRCSARPVTRWVRP